jgi:hypothetical protein
MTESTEIIHGLDFAKRDLEKGILILINEFESKYKTYVDVCEVERFTHKDMVSGMSKAIRVHSKYRARNT